MLLWHYSIPKKDFITALDAIVWFGAFAVFTNDFWECTVGNLRTILSLHTLRVTLLQYYVPKFASLKCKRD